MSNDMASYRIYQKFQILIVVKVGIIPFLSTCLILPPVRLFMSIRLKLVQLFTLSQSNISYMHYGHDLVLALMTSSHVHQISEIHFVETLAV
jgi:uncharacterized metal-binding protein